MVSPTQLCWRYHSLPLSQQCDGLWYQMVSVNCKKLSIVCYYYYHYNYDYYTPHTTKLLGGVLVSLRPSVRPASRVRSVVPTVLVGSISYLCILSSNFRRCVSCKVFCKILKFWIFGNFFKMCNFGLFWLEIWCESLVWVIMGRWGGSQNAGVLVVLVVAVSDLLHARDASWLWLDKLTCILFYPLLLNRSKETDMYFHLSFFSIENLLSFNFPVRKWEYVKFAK